MYIYPNKYLHLNSHIYPCIYIYIYLYLHVQMYILIAVCVYIYTYVYIYMLIHIHVTHLYTFIYAYVYVYIYVCMYVCMGIGLPDINTRKYACACMLPKLKPGLHHFLGHRVGVLKGGAVDRLLAVGLVDARLAQGSPNQDSVVF